MDIVFYSIWRNKYIRENIRKRVLQNRVIDIKSLKDLDDNQHYFSLIREQDRLDNCIYFRLNLNEIDQYNQYICSKYKHLVNDIRINNSKIDFDFNQIPHGVRKFYCFFNRTTKVQGTLPQSLTELIIYSGEQREFSSVALDSVLSNLPSSLQRVALPYFYRISTVIELQSTSTFQLISRKRVSHLRNLIIPPNLECSNLQVEIFSTDDLQWTHSAPWIRKLIIHELDIYRIRCGMIPPHIKDITICTNIRVQDGALPESLTAISDLMNSITTLVLPQQHLSDLHLYKLIRQIDKDMLPSTLKTLAIKYYDSPLLPGVLPENLTSLSLFSFNNELGVGVLPLSLEYLHLPKLNHLKPFVLPPRLNTLILHEFIGSIVANSLPTTLTHLDLRKFNGSFEYAPQMNHLSFLHLDSINQSVSRVIHNTNNIRLTCQTIDHDFNIHHSSIQHLEIIVYDKQRVPLSTNFIPKQIKTLIMYGIDINHNNLIPITCTRLQTDIKDLNLDLIPSTSKHRGFITP